MIAQILLCYEQQEIDELIKLMQKFNGEHDSLLFYSGFRDTNLHNVNSQIAIIDFKTPELLETYGNKTNFVIPKNLQFSEITEKSNIFFRKKY